MVAVFTPIWLRLWCDPAGLRIAFHRWLSIYPDRTQQLAPWLILAVFIILTWRLLVGSIYLGLDTLRWPLRLALCSVFCVLFGAPMAFMWVQQHPVEFRKLLVLPGWLPTFLAVVAVIKMAVSLWIGNSSVRKAIITGKEFANYILLCVFLTLLLVAVLVLLSPFGGWPRRLLMGLYMLLVPTLRISCAPLVLTHAIHPAATPLQGNVSTKWKEPNMKKLAAWAGELGGRSLASEIHTESQYW